MSRAAQALEAWRAAERRLEAVTDPDERSDLEAEVAELRHAYEAAVEEAGPFGDGPTGRDAAPSLA